MFGNTVYSASLVVAVFMLGLGAGSFLLGRWGDRRYSVAPDSLLRSYGAVELVIGAGGFGISLLLPRLGRLSALVSAYSQDATGWHVLSAGSHAARAGIAIALLVPITLLMGGTLSLLIRHVVRADPAVSGWRIALLYGINTVGAALGAFVTDFALVPAVGLRITQGVAALLNVAAGLGAFILAMRTQPDVPSTAARRTARGGRTRRATIAAGARPSTAANASADGAADGQRPTPKAAVALIGVSLAMAGFSAMGMEILWFRHFTILLGGFRAVFSLLLTIILLGIGLGSLVAGVLERRSNRPATWLIVSQALFVSAALAGLTGANGAGIDASTDPASRTMVGRSQNDAAAVGSEFARSLDELWFNARPMLLEIGLPVLLMGLTFPLANAVVQRTERSVGRRAGMLYLSNTAGAVCGSLTAGFLLLPILGLQSSATVLMAVSSLSMVPLFVASSRSEEKGRMLLSGSLLLGGLALALWTGLPSGYVIDRALARPANGERLLVVREGVNEVIAATAQSDGSRRLLTNGHPMSATNLTSQRYMRALAHIPLLAMDDPQTVLVIGFGVGNTTHAATLHPTVRRVEVADLSRDILDVASYFAAVNHDVLRDARVDVYVNDGRQHLQMASAGRYDLITLEPPPIGYAGVAALYSREFYELARSRLTPKGFVSQWLPAYQVPAETTLAMIRAFIDVFPHAVLLSGSEADLMLLGTNGSSVEIEPARVAARLSAAPMVRADLQRLDLDAVREIVGTFVGSATRLAEAVRDRDAVTDDHPVQEYGVRSLLNFGEAVPASIVDLGGVSEWCPACFVDGKPVPVVNGLQTYLGLMARAYGATPAEVAAARGLADRHQRRIDGSAYLGAIVPETADVHNFLGITHAEKAEMDEAIVEFRRALTLAPADAATHWHLGAALASRGSRDEAIAHLQRAVELDPSNADARRDLETMRQRR